MKRTFCLALTGLLLNIAGCGEDDDPSRNNDFLPLTGITIESENPQIAAGTSNRFTAMGDFSGAFSREVAAEFSTPDSGILVFDRPETPGIALGIAPGTATVNASVGEVTDSIEFIVTDETIETIALTPDTISLPRGTTRQFTATGTFSGGTVQNITRDVEFTSSNPELLTIESGGLATAVSAGGPVTISAAFDGVTGTAEVTVTEPVADSLAIDPTEPLLIPGETVQLTATALLTDDTEAEVTDQATWESSDTAVATVDANGLLTAESAGEATITAVFDDQTATADLTVATPDSIDVTPDSDTISVDETLQLTAEATLPDNTIRDATRLVSWESDDTEVATVTSAGLVRGRNAGTTTIHATLDGIPDSAVITVQ